MTHGKPKDESPAQVDEQRAQGRPGQGPRGGPRRPPLPRGTGVLRARAAAAGGPPTSIEKKLTAIDAQLAEAEPLTRLHLIQEKKDLEEELARAGEVQDLSGLEKQFVKVAKSYGERKGIGYSTWRSAGVSAAVLQKANVARLAGLSSAASDRPQAARARGAAPEQRPQQHRPVGRADQLVRRPARGGA